MTDAAATRDPLRLAVLISGSGTTLQCLVDAIGRGELRASVAGVISNRDDAFGLVRARDANVPAYALPAGGFAGRDAYDEALGRLVDGLCPDVVILAGFMRILTGPFVQRYAGRMLNIHPSLLPKYKGLDTYRRVLAGGDRWHGSSVHYVTEELDGGPVVAQSRVAVLPGDDAAALSARVQAAERRLYPRVVGWIADGRLTLRDNRPFLDAAWLAGPVVFDEDL